MSRKARLPLKDSLLKSMYEEAQQSGTDGPALVKKLEENAAKIELARQHRPDKEQAAASSDKRSDLPVEQNGLTKRSDQMVEPFTNTVQSDQKVPPKYRSDQTVEPQSPAKRSDQTVGPVGPDGATKRSNQTVGPSGHTVNLNTPRPLARTAQQRAVYGYLAANPDIITSINNLSKILTIVPTTLIKILRLFERGEVVKKYRIGNDGLHIMFCSFQRSDRLVEPSGPTKRSDQNASKKIDRKENLSISQEDMALQWPNLVRCGFGPDQLTQIEGSLSRVGKPTDRIIQGLDHLEYELANDQLVDKSGQPVADPCSWAFRALAQNGYYRRPKGYVSADEQASKDAEEEARAVIAARQKAEQAQFEAWRDGLSPDDLADALRGHPGGPKDAWMKKVWKERIHENQAR